MPEPPWRLRRAGGPCTRAFPTALRRHHGGPPSPGLHGRRVRSRSGTIVAPGDVVAQAEQVMANLHAALHAAGASSTTSSSHRLCGQRWNDGSRGRLGVVRRHSSTSTTTLHAARGRPSRLPRPPVEVKAIAAAGRRSREGDEKFRRCVNLPAPFVQEVTAGGGRGSTQRRGAASWEGSWSASCVVGRGERRYPGGAEARSTRARRPLRAGSRGRRYKLDECWTRRRCSSTADRTERLRGAGRHGGPGGLRHKMNTCPSTWSPTPCTTRTPAMEQFTVVRGDTVHEIRAPSSSRAEATFLSRAVNVAPRRRSSRTVSWTSSTDGLPVVLGAASGCSATCRRRSPCPSTP